MTAGVHSPVTVDVVPGVPGPEWNEFVHAHAAGSVFHLSEWAAVYGELSWIEPCYLQARRGAAVVGVMPLALVRWWPRGRALVSAPYCVEAGALGLSAAIQSDLEDTAAALARTHQAAFLEVRQSAGAHVAWPATGRFCGFARALAPTVAANRQAIPRKQRAMIRKGEAAGLVVGGPLGSAAFYQLYALSVRNLGTPVFAPQLFAAIARHLAPYVDTLSVHHHGRLVAAVMSFYFRDCVLPYYAGALPQARALKAYDFMYWRLLCAALERGCTRFDFGRSVRDSGAYAFKKNWGFEPRSLCYQLLPIASSGDHSLDPDSPFNHLARQLWSRLPLPVANTLGPLLARRLF